MIDGKRTLLFECLQHNLIEYNIAKNWCKKNDAIFLPCKYVPFSTEILDEQSNRMSPNWTRTVSIGSINMNLSLYNGAKGKWFGQELNCDSYYRRLNGYLLQKKWTSISLKHLVHHHKQGIIDNFADKDGNIFIRPVSGYKEFSGQVINLYKINEWMNALPVKPLGSTDCIVSQVIDIKKRVAFCGA